MHTLSTLFPHSSRLQKKRARGMGDTSDDDDTSDDSGGGGSGYDDGLSDDTSGYTSSDDSSDDSAGFGVRRHRPQHRRDSLGHGFELNRGRPEQRCHVDGRGISFARRSRATEPPFVGRHTRRRGHRSASPRGGRACRRGSRHRQAKEEEQPSTSEALTDADPTPRPSIVRHRSQSTTRPMSTITYAKQENGADRASVVCDTCGP